MTEKNYSSYYKIAVAFGSIVGLAGLCLLLYTVLYTPMLLTTLFLITGPIATLLGAILLLWYAFYLNETLSQKTKTSQPLAIYMVFSLPCLVLSAIGLSLFSSLNLSLLFFAGPAAALILCVATFFMVLVCWRAEVSLTVGKSPSPSASQQADVRPLDPATNVDLAANQEAADKPLATPPATFPVSLKLSPILRSPASPQANVWPLDPATNVDLAANQKAAATPATPPVSPLSPKAGPLDSKQPVSDPLNSDLDVFTAIPGENDDKLLKNKELQEKVYENVSEKNDENQTIKHPPGTADVFIATLQTGFSPLKFCCSKHAVMIEFLKGCVRGNMKAFHLALPGKEGRSIQKKSEIKWHLFNDQDYRNKVFNILVRKLEDHDRKDEFIFPTLTSSNSREDSLCGIQSASDSGALNDSLCDIQPASDSDTVNDSLCDIQAASDSTPSENDDVSEFSIHFTMAKPLDKDTPPQDHYSAIEPIHTKQGACCSSDLCIPQAIQSVKDFSDRIKCLFSEVDPYYETFILTEFSTAFFHPNKKSCGTIFSEITGPDCTRNYTIC